MKFLKLFLIGLTVIVSQNLLNAQVDFKIERIGDDEYYKVSLISDKTYTKPLNITSTAQVTIKVPTDKSGLGGFIPSNLQSLQPGLKWVINGRSNAPKEDPAHDYIYFGLNTLGTGGLNYEEGVELPLFLFYNAGNCIGKISLMDNNTDPFMAPNSRSANVGNQITILGAGGNAWKGNASSGYTECSKNARPKDPGFELMVTPNPAVNQVEVRFRQEGNDDVSYYYSLRDVNGKVMVEGQSNAIPGLNTIQLNISSMPSGHYVFELQREGKKVLAESIIKSSL